MSADYFQIVRRDGTSAIPRLESLPDVNITNEEGQNLLHVAIAYGNTSAALELIRRGINVDAQDSGGQTPLHFAGLYRNAEVARHILDNGGDFSITDSHGNSPLWTAVFNARGEYSVVELLVRYGAAQIANLKNSHGRSVMDFAAQIGDKHIVELLRD